MDVKWRRYEDTARILLMHLSTDLGLARVEGKQKLVGRSSEWEVDAKGIAAEDGKFVIVECRQYRTSRINQEEAGGLAFRLIDTGAVGGIFVSPLPLQEGAQRVAAANNIVHVQIDADSTPASFAMRFLNKLFLGVPSIATATAFGNAQIHRVCRTCGLRFAPVGNESSCSACIRT